MFVWFLNYVDQGGLPHFATMMNFWIITLVLNVLAFSMQSIDHTRLQRIPLCCIFALSSILRRKTNDIQN